MFVLLEGPDFYFYRFFFICCQPLLPLLYRDDDDDESVELFFKGQQSRGFEADERLT